MANNQPFVGGLDKAGAVAHRANGYNNVIEPIEITVVGQPAVGAQATAGFAAVAGVKYICRSISLSLAAQAGVAAGFVKCMLRDGATGVGAVIWLGVMGVDVAGRADHIVLSGLNIDGTTGNAMTLEFIAGFANAIEAVTLGVTAVDV